MTEKASISIPKNLYAQLEDRVRGTEFSSVSDYVAFVLTELLVAEKQEAGNQMSEDDEKKVTGRLRSLGYVE